MKNFAEKVKIGSQIINNSQNIFAFTGAGISVESGIPPFRGENGLWNKYDPMIFDINYFKNDPKFTWRKIKEVFYNTFQETKPNAAHLVLAELEEENVLDGVITQNIDNLHYQAGNNNVYEVHGNLIELFCLECKTEYNLEDISLIEVPPNCKKCGGILKPNIVFFGDSLPSLIYQQALDAANKSDVFILIGTTGEVAPANMLPCKAKETGAKIIEINPNRSRYTNDITDLFLQTKATVGMEELKEELDSNRTV